MSDQMLLEVRDLRVSFDTPFGLADAVRGVNFTVRKGEVMGLVGESGSGKSISMRAAMGLLPSSATVTGSVKLLGRELIGCPTAELRKLRGSQMAMIFQDPLTALNPVINVGQQIIEALKIHDPGISKKEARARAIELFREVAIPFPEKRVDQYPHEFSGGMRQRVVIAIAIANNPRLIIADEPTTALDVTVQAQVLELLRGLCEKHNTGLILITHDLGVVANMAEQVSVMYAGSIVERASVDLLFEHPQHPYTRGLLGSLPQLTGDISRLSDIGGAPPNVMSIPDGCAFAPRCSIAVEACSANNPRLSELGGSQVACHLAGQLGAFQVPGREA